MCVRERERVRMEKVNVDRREERKLVEVGLCSAKKRFIG